MTAKMAAACRFAFVDTLAEVSYRLISSKFHNLKFYFHQTSTACRFELNKMTAKMAAACRFDFVDILT